MKRQEFLTRFSSLSNQFALASADDLFEVFVGQYGLRWADRVGEYASHAKLSENRKGFFDFYFDSSLALSVRSDPRSGVFVRDPSSEGGKTELLLHLAFGIENFAALACVKREINGREQQVNLGGVPLALDFGRFEDVKNNLQHLMSLPEAVWDDATIKPSFEDALAEAKVALLEASKASWVDPIALDELLHVVLCGGHCTHGQKCGMGSVAEKMSEILTITAAVRAAAKKVRTSVMQRTDA